MKNREEAVRGAIASVEIEGSVFTVEQKAILARALDFVKKIRKAQQ